MGDRVMAMSSELEEERFDKNKTRFGCHESGWNRAAIWIDNPGSGMEFRINVNQGELAAIHERIGKVLKEMSVETTNGVTVVQ